MTLSPSARLVVRLDAFEPATVMAALAEYEALLPSLSAKQRATLRRYVSQARRYVADYSPGKAEETR